MQSNSDNYFKKESKNDKKLRKDFSVDNVEFFLQDFEKRMDNLEDIGRKRGKRNKIRAVLGIFLSILACAIVLFLGYKFLPEVTRLTSEVDRISQMTSNSNFSFTTTTERLIEMNKPVMRRKWQRCELNSDCIQVQSGCCVCEKGGEQFAMNKKYLGVWEDEIDENCDVECSGENKCNMGASECIDSSCVFVSKDCFGDGAEIVKDDTVNYNAECCEGLIEISMKDEDKIVCSNCGDTKCVSPENETNCYVDCSLENIIATTWKNYTNIRFAYSFSYPEEWYFDNNLISPNVIEHKTNGSHNAPIKFLVFSEERDVFLNDEEITSNKFNYLINNAERIATDTTMIINDEEYSFYHLKDYGRFEGTSAGEVMLLLKKFEREDNELFFGFEWIEFPGGKVAFNSKKDFLNIISTLKFNKDKLIDDMDNDSLSDSDEIYYGTDPENADSDGDGYLDGDEVEKGYDPSGEDKL